MNVIKKKYRIWINIITIENEKEEKEEAGKKKDNIWVKKF